jgi:hypothetical protein
MTLLDSAVRVDDEQVFNALPGDAHEAVIEYRLTMPFNVQKDAHERDENDVVVYGPVYVGDDSMLDRHRELVDPEAILRSWSTYQQNPVILYNHRKDYGVIGMMESVEMGTFTKEDGTEIDAVFGRAIIDGGEEAIARKVRKGMLRAFSIGFIAKAAVKEGNGDEAYLKFTDVEWIETSVVDIPASRNALFDVQKSVVSYAGSKHLIAVEDTGETFRLEFAKDEMQGEPAGPTDEVERGLDIDEVVELSDAIALLEAKMAELVERMEGLAPIESVKNHVADPLGMTGTESDLVDEVVETKTEDELIEVDMAPVEKHEGGDETLLEEEAEEEAEEAPESVEEAEEVSEEPEVLEEAEEAAEEVSEEVEEKAVEEEADLTVDVMSEVVRSLTEVEATLAGLVSRLDETESLKALVAERDATIEGLMAEKAEAEKAAEVEAAVSKRLSEVMAEVGLPVETAKPKSLSPAVKAAPVEKTGVTKHDPQPAVSGGVAALGSWLEGRLGDRRLD